MRNLRKLAIAVLFCWPALAAAQSTEGTNFEEPPLTAGEHRNFAKLMVRAGREIKHSFTDLRHDKQWLAMNLIAAGALAFDMKSTCDGFHAGFVEGQAPFKGVHNCAQITAGSIALHEVQIFFIHSAKTVATVQCDADLHTERGWRWAHDGKHGAFGDNPKVCGNVVQWIGLLPAANHIEMGIANYSLYDHYMHKIKP